MGFKRGGDSAESMSKGAAFSRTDWFGIEDGERAILRFVTDEPDWLTVQCHQSVPTRSTPPPGWPENGKWPQYMPAVCRKTLMEGDEPFSESCWICENLKSKDKNGNPIPFKKSGRTYALACLREEVMGTEEMVAAGSIPADKVGKRVGFRDKTREVAVTKDGQPTGEVRVEKAIVVVEQGWKNFFAAVTALAGIHGTVLDRDIVVIRKGTGLETDYQIVGLDPIQTKNEAGETVNLDLRDPEIAARYVHDIDLEAVVLDRISDEYYQKFFMPITEGQAQAAPAAQAAPVEANGAQAAPPAAQPATVPTGEVSGERLAALASRVTGHPQPAEAQPSTEAQAPVEEAPAPAEAAPAAAAAVPGGLVDFTG